MDAVVQHLHVVTLYLYFEEEGGRGPIFCCSSSDKGMALSPPGSSPRTPSPAATALLMLLERTLQGPPQAGSKS
jgi:hypothetical protein